MYLSYLLSYPKFQVYPLFFKFFSESVQSVFLKLYLFNQKVLCRTSYGLRGKEDKQGWQPAITTCRKEREVVIYREVT